MTPSGAGVVPPEVLGGVLEALGWPPSPAAVRARRLGGGCVHPAAHLAHPDPGRGRPSEAFLKWSPPVGTLDPARPSPFEVEAAGLARLAARGGVRIPRVLGWQPVTPSRSGWLLLEYLPTGPPPADAAERLGRGLAHLHRPLRPDLPPGLETEGWIATLEQDNRPRRPWARFWQEARLLPQRIRAHSKLSPIGRRRIDEVLDRTTACVAGAADTDGGEGLSLLHGDLWSGNVLQGPEGPALVDPAVYRGHREVDLAMMELFGGFSSRVFEAYEAVAPLRPGYPTVRRPLYQLHPLLVHVQLFGQGYVSRAEAVAGALLAELG